jgi:cell division protein FtsW
MDDLWQGYGKYVALVCLIVLPMAFEKDFGTAVIVAIIAFLMFFFAEIRLTYILATALSFLTAGLIYLMTSKYMLYRINSYIDQLMYNKKYIWQLDQSLISFGLGGIWGQGIGSSRQKYHFLPEAHKDFIFSIIGEELGFIGAVGTLLLFFLIIYRGIKIAQTAPDGYGRILAGGLTACVATYAFVNAAVATAVLPTTGIPMPFVSYGGSAIVSHLAGIGLLVNISSKCDDSYTHYYKWSTYKKRLNRKLFRL